MVIILWKFNRRKIHFDIENQFDEFLPIVIDLFNNIRLWEHRGHTNLEIGQPFDLIKDGLEWCKEEDVVEKKKIGRNERCPCGSGKKYKKCCGMYL